MSETSRREQFAFHVYYAGLLLLAFSLPLSEFGMSISQLGILASWVIGGNFSGKIRSFLSNKVALSISAIFLLHVIGLAWTEDFAYAYKDLRIKVPLLMLPLIVSTSPSLTKRQTESIYLTVIAGAMLSTLISMGVYLGVGNYEINSTRDISIFISHIRLALICCVAVFIAIWLIREYYSTRPFIYHALLALSSLWLIFFIFLIQGLTAITVILIAPVVLAIVLIVTTRNNFFRIGLLLTLLLPGIYLFSTVSSVMKEMTPRKIYNLEDLPETTPNGNPYVHILNHKDYENGHAVWLFVSEKELREEWNLRSDLDFDSLDHRSQLLRTTLMRYLSSKGLTKDSAGVWALSDQEIQHVENGIANIYYVNMTGLKSRIHQVLWELEVYRNWGNPSGKSVSQRLEYWKTGLAIVAEHPLYGVGTGDVPATFKNQYIKMDSPLDERWRLRSHNQFLSMAVAFGIPGLIWFLFALLYPVIISVRQRNILYIAFAVAAILSMVTEDTLETQPGVTFFTLFTVLFLFIHPGKETVGGN